MRLAFPVLAALMLCMQFSGQRTQAQSPDQVQAEIVQQGGAMAPCLLAIAGREDPSLDPHQANLQGSGALGLFQMMPATWASTPPGQAGIALSVATVAQQVEAAVWLLLNGWKSAWNPTPDLC